MATLVKAGERFDRYRLESELGAGGMGRVFRAFDERLHRTVALKMLLIDAGGDPAELEVWKARMIREARAAAALNHPHIVSLHDVGESEGMPFLVMEFVAGSSMRAYVGDRDVPWARRVRWLVEVAEALGAAHAAGIVHRDVKPENVLVREDGTAKVADFGIARRRPGAVDPTAPTHAAEQTTLTAAGAVVGTPAYMAPEQIQGDAVDGRTDQFAWGVMAFELSSGSLPWPARDAMALVAAIMTVTPPPLETLAADIPAELSRVVARAMSRDPAARFDCMEDVADALRPFAEQRSGSRPVSPRAATPIAPSARVPAPPEHATPAPSAKASSGAGMPVTVTFFVLLLILAWFARGFFDAPGKDKAAGSSSARPTAAPSASPPGGN